MEHYKDRSPNETIKIIKDYFNSKNYIIEKTSNVNISDAFWCHIELFDSEHKLLLAKSNGKGSTALLCEASAYGELYERYCANSLDTLTYDQNNLDYKLKVYADTISVALTGGNLLTSEYSNIQTGEKKYWSRTSLTQLFGSTGLACGNTYEEAVLQGLCEICERYAITQIVNKNKQFGILIEKHYLSDLDVTINVFDLSEDFKMPIIAIQVLDNKNFCIGYSFGCHPIKEIAIERCITEFFQGNVIYMDKILIEESRLMPKNYQLQDYQSNQNLLNIFKLGKGYIPKEKFRYDTNNEYNDLFLKGNYTSNKELLEDFIRTYINCDIYAANISKIDNMYAVHVFSPNLELEEETNQEISEENLEYYQQELLLNMILKNAIQNRDIVKMIHIISDMATNNIRFFNIFYPNCRFKEQLDNILLLIYSIYTKNTDLYNQQKEKIHIDCSYLDNLCHIDLNKEVDFKFLLSYII